MSDHSHYHPPAAIDPALDFTGAQGSDAASGGHAEANAPTWITDSSPLDPEWMAAIGRQFDSEQPLTPGGPSTSFAQRISADYDSFPELGQPVASDPLRQSLPSDDDTLNPFSKFDQQMASDVLRQPLLVDNGSADPVSAIKESMISNVFECAQQEQQPSSVVSANDLFHVSFASEQDLETLSEIHASASASDPLACFTMRQPRYFGGHLEKGRFHYGQAFAAKDGAVILKVTNKDSEEVVGCAWLQRHILRKMREQVPICQADDSLPRCMKTMFYKWFHTQIHKHRQTALFKHQQTALLRNKTRRYRTLHYFVRSLDVLATLSVDHRLQVHRKLVSFISQFEPEHDLFAQVPCSDLSKLKTFEDEGWQRTVDRVISAKSCPQQLVASSKRFPNTTLSGWLRAGVEQDRAEPQTLVSQEISPPESLSGAAPRAIHGDPHGSSLEEQSVHKSASASSVYPRSDGSRLAPQDLVEPDGQDRARVDGLPQDPNSESLSTRRENPRIPMETPLAHQSAVPPDEHPRPSQQRPNNQAVSRLSAREAYFQTVTVNIFADRTLPFDSRLNGQSLFAYTSTSGVPVLFTVSQLMRILGLVGTGLRPVTVAVERKWVRVNGVSRWVRGETFIIGTLAAERRLAELGWGFEVDPVWLAVGFF